MLLGVVSDTHGHVEFTRGAISALEAADVEEVIHCGDIGSADIIPLLAAWPTHFVFGNVDGNYDTLRQAIDRQAHHQCHGRFGKLERRGRKIAFLHGDDTRRLAETIDSGDWDLVCYGHTHVAHREHRDRTLVLNPGAVFRANPHSIAVVQIPELQVQVIKI